LEQTFKGHLVQAPCKEWGHLQLDQVSQSPVQSDLEWKWDGISTMVLEGYPGTPPHTVEHCHPDYQGNIEFCTLFLIKFF